MPLQIGGSGTGKPFLKFNAKADKWFFRGASGEDAEIPRPTFVDRLRQHRHRLDAVPRGPGAGAGDGPEHRSAGAVAGRGIQARLRGDDLSARSSSAGRPSSPAPRSISRTRSRTSTRSTRRSKANHRGELPVVACTGSRGDEGSLRHQLPADLQDRAVGRAADRFAEPSPVDAADVWTRRQSAAHRAAPRRPPSTCRRRRRHPSLLPPIRSAKRCSERNTGGLRPSGSSPMQP